MLTCRVCIEVDLGGGRSIMVLVERDVNTCTCNRGDNHVDNDMNTQAELATC